jgi:hypothetical protein
MSSFHLGVPSELQLLNTLNRGSVLVGGLVLWYVEYSIQLYWMSGPFRVADCDNNYVDLKS